MRLYSYIVKHDTGFSPNPFWGYCTLADCKPAIRRTARVGDWVVGLSPKAKGNRIVYAMRVDEILPYHEYCRDKRFANKIPDYAKGPVVYKCGDNIYKPLPNGEFQQLRSMHSNGQAEDPEKKAHDLGGKNVLVSRQFYYFGQKVLSLPPTLQDLKVGRAHKNRFAPEVVSAFLEFIASQQTGVHAAPSAWPSDDASWRMD